MVAFATQVKRRRGTTAQNDAFTGAEGEIVVDTQKHTLRVHDGKTQGGFEMATQADLDNKADTDLGNIPTNYDYVVESQEPTAENGYTWYRKYKSGWVEQGGVFTATSVADGSGTAGNNTINLPIVMANDQYWYSANTQVGSSGWDYANGVILNARSTTTLILKVIAGTGNMGLFWQVSGVSAQ